MLLTVLLHNQHHVIVMVRGDLFILRQPLIFPETIIRIVYFIVLMFLCSFSYFNMFNIAEKHEDSYSFEQK